ncbi:MAG: hypothetical protein K0S57_1355 [Ramlibacter sp.]|jgi:hypothetical protein|nr:hypothetical protein [Ramlibacter sp.]
MNIKPWAIAAALLSAGVAQATCYSVYKADGTIIQETSNSPVDLTLPIGDTIPVKFGTGASMTISESGYYCKDRGVPIEGAPKSLAQIVQAEEEKRMVLKAPAAKVEAVKVAVAKQEAPKAVVAKQVDPNAATLHEEGDKAVVAREDGAKAVMVKQDGTTSVVETRTGTVLKMKGKKKEAQ